MAAISLASPIATAVCRSARYSDPTGQSLHKAVLAGIGIAALGVAAWVGNDIIDNDSDCRFGRTIRVWRLYVSGGTRATNGHRVAAIASAAIFALVGLMALHACGAGALTYGALLLIIGLAYSLPPIKLKVRGVWGGVVTAIAAGCLPFMAGAGATDFRVHGEMLWFPISLSLLFLAGDCIAHELDRHGDEVAGLRTIATVLGSRGVLILSAASAVGALLVQTFGFIFLGIASSVSGLALMVVLVALILYMLSLIFSRISTRLAKARIVLILSSFISAGLLLSGSIPKI